jgi:branched-chain amino acid transport system substrate-binding protein
MNRTIITLALSASLVVACGGEQQEGATGSTVQGVTDTEIVIGSQNDLSGPAAPLGVGIINAARLRFDEANAAGGIHGRKIRFVVEDAQYQLPKAIQAANKLINRDKILLMFMAMGTPMNVATMQALFDAGVPNLFPVSGGRQMVEPFQALQFTARGVYYDETRAGVAYFIKERGAEKVCVMYQDSEFGLEIYEATRDQLQAAGMEITAQSAHKPTDTEFTAPVLRMRNAGCEVIMLGTIYKDTILIFEAARKMGWDNVAFVGQNAAYSKAVAASESGAAEGYFAFVHIAAIYADDEMSPEVRAFFDAYAERFGSEPGYPAIEGYRNADLLVQVLQGVGPELTADRLVEELESIAEYRDIFGYRLTFGPEDHKGVDESVLVTVKNGRWILLEESISY